MVMTSPSRMELDSTEDVFLQDDLGPTIAEHALQCSQLFKKYMAAPEVAPDPTLMDDQLARFTLWTSNMDVFGPLNVSLDYRLRYSPTVVEIIHQLLDVICRSLSSLKPIDDRPQTLSRKKRRIPGTGSIDDNKRADNDSSETDNDESQADKNRSLIVHTIGGTVTRLFRLSNAIRKSANASRTQKLYEYKDDEEANEAVAELRLYTEYYICFRFPQVPEALRTTLVEANALRLRRLYYQRSHRRRIALSVQYPQAYARNILSKMPDSTPTARFAPNVPPKSRTIDEGSKPTSPPASITYATTARQTAVRALYADSTVEVPRAKSVLVNNKLSFPPVPTESECPYCGVIVELRGDSDTVMWNDHVIRDLEPFVCVFAHFPDSSQKKPGLWTFETSEAWIGHMKNAHGYVWECRAPCHDPTIFEQEIEFQEHSRKEHSVPEARVGTLSGAARRPIPEKILECPFGDEFSAPEEAESDIVFSSEALRLHVATHMKEIALLSLQKLPGDDDSKSEDVASNQHLDDGGFTKLRESMHSILDNEALDFSGEAKDDDSKVSEDGSSPSTHTVLLGDNDAARMTKLHLAVQSENLPWAQSLIDQGEDLRSRTNQGKTALHYASLNRYKRVDMMKLLLNSGAREIMSLKDNNGQTPLHYAAKSDCADGIKLLVEYGAHIDVIDNHGFSPYLWAVIAGGLSATRILLSLGGDVNSTSADGKSALGWAASLGSSLMTGLLVKKGADVMSMTQNTQLVPLEAAAASGDWLTVRSLFDAGADPNYRDREGWSAIHWAAEEGHWGVVLLLLNHGADINAVSSYGTSPLHCAANGGHNDIVIKLLERGADPLKSTCQGWTPLHHAAFMGHSRVVRSLLNSDRITPSSSHDQGWSVLHLAVHGRHLDTIRVLLDSSIISDSRLRPDESGFTAEQWLDFKFDSHSYRNISNLAFSKSRCCRAVTRLRQAVYYSNIAMTELFLEHGNDVNGTDSGRRTALYYAAKKGHITIMNMLLDKGADPNILPAGYRAWEEFISDKAVLQRLRQAGYRKPTPNPEIDHQIRLALRGEAKPTL
ncbi:ankyrin [Xylaria scruposa]|nr:ankyrin [Xylaria scruposa]